MNVPPRGNALTFVLLLIAVLMVFLFAGTLLQPLELRALDAHLEAANAQAFGDAALETALARLDAGQSPVFASTLKLNDRTADIHVQQLGTSAAPVLLATVTMPTVATPEEPAPPVFKLVLRAAACKGPRAYQLSEFKILSAVQSLQGR